MTFSTRFQPHLIYLSGHGHFEHEAHNKKAWGSFWFEDEWGRQQKIKESELAGCFQTASDQLLVLSACLRAKQHADYTHNGLSQVLYEHGIPHVIGMRETVFDKAGIQFAKTLLHSLAKQHPVDIALQTARAAITKSLQDSVYKDLNDPERTEVSYGQWCLPQLLSHQLDHALIDWNFTPVPQQQRDLKTMLGKVSIPERFIGSRRELRKWQNQLRSQSLNTLLITGAGGMGKTALAGKLLTSLSKDGYHTYTFSLNPEHQWHDVLLEMELALADNDSLIKKYQIIQSKRLGAAKQTEYLLQYMLQHYDGKLALLFDNLESVQRPQTPHAITDSELQHWLSAAQHLSKQGLKLIATSRWRLLDWGDDQHIPLGKTIYNDFVACARQQQLPMAFLKDQERMQRAYQTLGGNFRALEFFSKATTGMNLAEEQIFLDKLAQAEAEIQVNMALAAVVAQCSAAETELLRRILTYQTPAPLDGVKVLAKTQLETKQAQQQSVNLP